MKEHVIKFFIEIDGEKIECSPGLMLGLVQPDTHYLEWFLAGFDKDLVVLPLDKSNKPYLFGK